MAEVLSIRFDGGLAAEGKLHFYEYSRSQYGFARFITTIEHYRRTGEVLDKITPSSRIDLVVSSPARGSFVEEILVPGIREGMAVVISTPITALISYLWSFISPRRERTDEIITDLARLRLADERERTAQVQEQTRQLTIFKDVIEGERATAKTALDLLGWALQNQERLSGRLTVSAVDLADAQKELIAEQQREDVVQEHKEALAKISQDDMKRLTSRLRPAIKEMALPLKRSADIIIVGEPNGHKPIGPDRLVSPGYGAPSLPPELKHAPEPVSWANCWFPIDPVFGRCSRM